MQIFEFILGVLIAIKNWIYGHEPKRVQKPHRPPQQVQAKPRSSIQPAPPEKKKPELYAGFAFSFKAGEKEAAQKNLYPPLSHGPTEAQLQLILTETTSLPVLAGAGSGKSTSLVNRLLVMINHLDASIETVAVFTFTRRSRLDFKEKLIKQSELWPLSITEERADRIVRTFHSKALELARPFIGEQTKIFEFLKDKKDQVVSTDDKEHLDDAIKQANFLDTFLSKEANIAQTHLISRAYEERYRTDQKFKTHINELLNKSFASTKLVKSKLVDKAADFTKAASQRDAAFVEYVETWWTKHGFWPLKTKNVQYTLNNQRILVSAMGQEFIANAYIPKTKTYIVLGAPYSIRNENIEIGCKKKIEAGLASLTKQRILLYACEENILFITKEKELKEFLEKLNHLEIDPKGIDAPKFLTKIPGGFKLMQVHLALFSFGGFAENLAIDPRKATSASELPEGSEGHHFLGATAGFFHSFYSLLDQENMITFNELFRRLSTKDVWLDRISLYNLRSMQHLLIDEFQDVSKAIVNLILGLHTRLKELSDGRIQPTLMCVGDDWQSIYGWRGSSPKFFMNFAQYFPGSRKVPVELNENFRSSQKVILAGESSLSGLQERIAKKNGLARHKEFAECSHPVLLISDHKEDDAVHIVKSILNLKAEDEKVFVLTRSNNDSTFEGIVAACRDWDESSLVATTIHQSKGLEAEYVVIIGDTVSFGSNPLHNVW